MATTDYDILIVGGGIYGCGIAQAASACGYRCLLIEQNTLASGTSSQSTKLIHGGLRYLEQFNLKLVYEALSERERLLQLAPELVSRQWFYIPIYQGNKRPPWMVACGLLLYFILSGGRSRFKWLPRSQWENTLPALNTSHLRAILAYEDAATDDAALTRAVAASARSLGCNIRENCALEHAEYDKNQWNVRLSTGDSLSAKILVNAAGPWVNTVHQCITPSPACIDIQLVQGSHLLLNRPCPGYVYTESLDGRVMFFRPWKGQTLAGTTETPLQDPPLNINPTASEICDILTTYNHYFPSTACDAHDIVRSFCGMRVLPQTHGSAFGASRETIMLCNPFGQAPYLAVYGGKLTTYRSESEKAVQLLKSFMPPPHKGSTRNMILSEHA